MDNIIKYLNFEDNGLEVLDQIVRDGKRILTVQKALEKPQKTLITLNYLPGMIP